VCDKRSTPEGWPEALRCERCGRPQPFDELTGEWLDAEAQAEGGESGWLQSQSVDADGYPTSMVCPACATVEEDAAATAEMLTTMRLLGHPGAPDKVDAEIDRVAERQRWAADERARGTSEPGEDEWPEGD
jgi:hypothetical protein